MSINFQNIFGNPSPQIPVVIEKGKPRTIDPERVQLVLDRVRQLLSEPFDATETVCTGGCKLVVTGATVTVAATPKQVTVSMETQVTCDGRQLQSFVS